MMNLFHHLGQAIVNSFASIKHFNQVASSQHRHFVVAMTFLLSFNSHVFSQQASPHPHADSLYFHGLVNTLHSYSLLTTDSTLLAQQTVDKKTSTKLSREFNSPDNRVTFYNLSCAIRSYQAQKYDEALKFLMKCKRVRIQEATDLIAYMRITAYFGNKQHKLAVIQYNYQGIAKRLDCRSAILAFCKQHQINFEEVHASITQEEKRFNKQSTMLGIGISVVGIAGLSTLFFELTNTTLKDFVNY